MCHSVYAMALVDCWLRQRQNISTHAHTHHHMLLLLLLMMWDQRNSRSQDLFFSFSHADSLHDSLTLFLSVRVCLCCLLFLLTDVSHRGPLRFVLGYLPPLACFLLNSRRNLRAPWRRQQDLHWFLARLHCCVQACWKSWFKVGVRHDSSNLWGCNACNIKSVSWMVRHVSCSNSGSLK